jgi:integrase
MSNSFESGRQRRNLTSGQIAYRKAAKEAPPWTRESRHDPEPGFVPDGTEAPTEPRREAPQKPRTITHKLDLTDPRIEARIEMNDEGNVIRLDDHGGNNSVPGLRIRIGPRSARWFFYRDILDHGERKITSHTLGRFPEMDTKAAREKAKEYAGNLVGGRVPVSRSGARKFGDEFNAYIAFLKEQAKDDDKVVTAWNDGKFAGHSRWSRNVLHIGNLILLPKWKEWTLNDMSDRRGDEVAQWYTRVLKDHGPTQANHAMRIMRAVYRRAAKADNSLSGDPTKLPTAAVKLRRENWQRNGKDKPGLAFEDFPRWLDAWRQLESPIHRWYHLVGLLTGARPGELCRTPRANLDLKSYTLTIGNSKSGADITIPLSPQIERALEKARAARPDGDLLFPTCEHAPHRDLSLPARGHAFRRIWKTVATDCGITNDQSALLLGHSLPGVSAGYMLRLVLTQGPLLRELQAKVSARICELLREDPTL